jgi:hypothetical protein
VGWVVAAVVVAFAGMVVIAFCAVRVFAALRRLGGELERASARLEPEYAALRTEVGGFAPAGE